MLRSTQLEYYDSNKIGRPVGDVLLLQDIVSIEAANLDPKKHDFVIVAHGREHKLRASSVEQMNEWILDLQQAVQSIHSQEFTTRPPAAPLRRAQSVITQSAMGTVDATCAAGLYFIESDAELPFTSDGRITEWTTSQSAKEISRRNKRPNTVPRVQVINPQQFVTSKLENVGKPEDCFGALLECLQTSPLYAHRLVASNHQPCIVDLLIGIPLSLAYFKSQGNPEQKWIDWDPQV